jgi:hypothetical protein
MLAFVLAAGLPLAAAAQAPGAIAGTVTASAGGSAVGSALVQVFDANRRQRTAAITDAAGAYSVAGLSAGTYYVRVSADGYVPELFDDIPCAARSCFDPSEGLGLSGTPVSVVAGGTTTVDVTLDRGGTIAGTVTRASDGTAVSGVNVLLYDSSTSFVFATSSAGDGSFTFTGLPFGSYLARTLSGRSSIPLPDYLDELFGGVLCPSQEIDPPGCRIDLGSPIVLSSGSPAAAANFRLDPAAAIAGRVTLAGTGAAVVALTIEVYSGAARVTFAATDGSGNYRVPGLSPGTYQVRTAAPAGSTLVDEWYQDACVACPGARPRGVAVTPGVTTGGIDFALDNSPGGISGSVTLPRLTQNVIMPDVQVFDADGILVKTAVLGMTVLPPAGETLSWSVTGLPPGTYYVHTHSTTIGQSVPIHSFIPPTAGQWIDELFDNITCVAADCDPRRGTPVIVSAGTTTSGVNFALEYGAQITGQVPFALLGSTRMDVYDSRGVPLPLRGSINAFASYSVFGLPAGSYYLVLHALPFSVPDILYKDIPCDGCAVTSGTPVTVGAGEQKTGIDFVVVGGRAISGSVRSDGSASPPNQPLSTITVEAFAPNGAAMASAVSRADGSYRLDNLPPGTYYLRTTNLRGFEDELFDDIECSGCDSLLGTAVTVAAGADTTNVDFVLGQAQTVSGMVALDNATPAGTSVVFYASTPATPAARATTDAFGAFTATLRPGPYFAQTDPVPGYVQQIYNGVACPQGICSTAAATPITVATSPVTGIDFSLAACPAPAIAPVRLAEAAVGVAYRQTLLATGGSGTKRFSVASTLPPGLTLDSGTGVISGTPTASGAYSFTIAAADGSGCAGVRAYTLDVPACVFTLDSQSAGFFAHGGPSVVHVTNTCGAFTVTTAAPWLSTQILSGSVVITAEQNSGASREATVIIGSRVFPVFQSGVATPLPFGFLDTPAAGAVVSGSMAISGWALDEIGSPVVAIYRDPVAGEGPAQVFIGTATFVDGARPDVEAAFPAFRSNRRAGWGYLLLTNMLPNRGNGVFNLYAYAVVSDGIQDARALLGVRTIIAVNSSAIAPFGAIDTPDQGATVAGSAFVNFGWALTPQPKMIPFDGSSIAVIVDGVPLGAPAGYNFFRSDVSTLFPGLANSSGPVGYRIIDTTALSEGLHTIAWSVTDDAGVTSGIGSRYFIVSNSAWQPALRSALAAPPAFTRAELEHADSTTAVPPRVDGLDLGRKAASLATLALDADGSRTVQLGARERLAVSLLPAAGPIEACGDTYEGYLVVKGELRALPVGSSLERSGTFYWQPGPGFFGRYQLVFIRTNCPGNKERIRLIVEVR